MYDLLTMFVSFVPHCLHMVADSIFFLLLALIFFFTNKAVILPLVFIAL